MSGSVTSNWAIQRDPLTLAKRQAALFNCPTDNSSSIYECLMQIDPIRLATSYKGLLEWGWDPLVQYAPVVEPAGSGEERFLTADPTTLLQAGQYSQMPLFIGMTKDEFSWRSTQVLTNESWYEDINTDYERIYPIAFMYERNTPRSRYITNELRKFYLNNEPIVNTTYNGLGLIYADALVGFGSDRESKLISSTNREPVYYYKFSYQGRYSFVYNPGTMTPYGVAHHDDLIYLFNISILFPSFQPGDQEIKTVERMTKLWANFIQTGNPTPEATELFDNTIWEPIKPSNLNYLDHGSNLIMKQGLYQDRMRLWDRLFPLPSDGTQITQDANIKNGAHSHQ